MKTSVRIALLPLILLFFMNFKDNTKSLEDKKNNIGAFLIDDPKDISTPEGMVWVKGKTFTQGAKQGDPFAMHREMPGHQVTVDGFFIDITEVTNKQFKAFVDATAYKTVAERVVDWEVMKKEFPDETPKPHDSILQPGSLVFNTCLGKITSMDNYTQWWSWQLGANWKHPEGPGSSIVGKENYPVVHIAFEDALAYCKWANRRLPTEAEWESAAQGDLVDAIYTWGNTPEILNQKANTWQGVFPVKNESKDGFEYIAPVQSYSPNSIGIYDMLGNVWEMTSDVFDEQNYKKIDNKKLIKNSKTADKTCCLSNQNNREHVIKGGSFLCNASYCASYRISAKMGMNPDSGTNHIGFRTVATVAMLR
ncbi:formylglycine-generating enzyme family protein [Flavobacterium sp. MAHUQ-51]|uniref:formylglycine-generating enzyme family protein n=1 Tax=Flavobacterium sp. GCM10022190 TaxID=3252639 RepID=UPI00360ED00A